MLKKRISEFDLVHLHSVFLWPTWVAARIAWAHGVPYVHAPRVMLVKDLVRRKSRWLKLSWITLIERRNLERAAALHLTTQQEYEELQAFRFRLSRVYEIPNGLELGEPTVSQDKADENMAEPFALFLGRVNWEKGLDRLVRAWGQVPEIRLVIAGNDEEGYTEKLQSLSKEFGVLDRIEFIGPVNDSQKQQLLEYKHQAAQEQEIAATLYKNIVHAGFYDTPEVKYRLSPMALFNGDIFLVAKTPGNQLYALLGDFTGHGLAASVGAGPAAEIFQGMAEKGFGISEIIIEINRKMHKLLPVNMFLAATIVAFFPDTGSISLITCGLPDHYLFNRTSKQLQVIVSKNLPLGIIDSFEPDMQTLPISKENFLYLFTDGVIEAENTLGEQFDAPGVIHSIENNAHGYEAVLSALDTHTKDREQQDDITFVELDCNISDAQWMQATAKKVHKKLVALSWKNSMEFQSSTLRHINPVPMVINSIMEIQGFIEHREAIFLIVTELFANALEHGLLGLDSKIKQSSEGFMQYYSAREERLAQLSDGYIKMSFNHQPTDAGGKLIIKMQDSGQGFDFSKVSSDLEHNEQSFGRGISLLLNLCKEVEYSGNGNRVKAVYEWTA